MKRENRDKRVIKQLTETAEPLYMSEVFFEVASSGFRGRSPWSVQSIQLSVEAENSVIFYAELDEKIVGFVVASKTPYALDIYMIVVDEKYKNNHIGRDLLTVLIAYAKENKIPEILLETRQSNAPAISLYRRVGFQPAGVRKAYYSSPIEDAVVMRKEV